MLMRMVTVGGIIRSITKSLFFFLYMAMIYGASSNRMSLRAVARLEKSKQGKAQDQFKKHWIQHVQNDPLPQNYQSAQSDAMELYSIGAGKLVMVQKSGQVWDDDYELKAIKSNRKGGKRNKFVTETVTYGKLKIRSEENKMYICAKNNGQIVFKNKAERSLGKKKRTRRRCLFMWSFTEEKHIQLYISSGGRDWYLAVQDGIVNLQLKNRSSAKQRSFIWLPTRSARRPKIRRNHNSRSSNSFTHARGFPLSQPGLSGLEEQRQCDALQKKVKEQDNIIDIINTEKNELKDENERLKEELRQLKELQTNSTNSTVSGAVHPTRHKRLMTSLSRGPR